MGGCKEGKRCQHLCKLAKRDEIKQLRALVKDAAYLCTKCGRAAREPDNLCEPSRL